MTAPDPDRDLGTAAERLARGRAAHPARPGAAGDPQAHLLAAALAGRRAASDGVPPRLRQRLDRLIAGELDARLGVAPVARIPAGGLTRRQWLTGAGAAVAAGVAGAAVGDLLPRRPAPAEQASELVPSAGVWRAIAPAAAVRPERPLPFVAGAVTGVLVRDGQGRVRALSAICTHLGCRVAWAAASQAFVCPCHGARFSASGRFAGAPWGAGYLGGLPPLPRLRIRITGDRIVEVLTAV
ncbi:MAG TPA: Rieske (2Fe-2S) protein [Verrucomicrobiae bacterium]|nr:Rieske (2Fe-2S) protein [Verrucomicrobiae bacterium]